MPARHRWRLTGPWPTADAGADVRSVAPTDAEGLAHLMLDAYRGTIDYEDEGIDEARQEVEAAFGRVDLLVFSRIVEVDGRPVSACLADRSGADEGFVSYLMTAADSKGRGLARRAMASSLAAFDQAGVRSVTGWITEGNLPSEAVFRALGAVVDDPD